MYYTAQHITYHTVCIRVCSIWNYTH